MAAYGIARLAAAIHELKKAGYKIITEMHTDGGDHPYARYFLQPRTVN